MKLIFISGPSGSGKTTLSKRIIGKIKNGIILSTDNYYKVGLITKFLSKFVASYFDRSISFNYKLFKKDFNFILKNGISIQERSYNFEKKLINNFFNETNNINFLIIEGIFAKEFSGTLRNQNYTFLELKINKNECMKRVILRDLKERGEDQKTS
jgi:uridine kinase